MTVEYRVGDVFDRLAEIPDGTIDLISTSPPFWRQRGYLPADHPDKAKEIGQEPTPADFVSTLLRLSAEFRRVLAPHGSIAVELADTMSGSGGAGGDYAEGGFRAGQPKWEGSGKGTWTNLNHDAKRRGGKVNDVLPKSHCMIPEAYRLALAWGLHPLTGEASPAGKWIIRNVVDWCRNNPTPGDDGDKFRRATSDIVIATLNPRRWWDGEAVRVPATGDMYARATNGRKAGAGDRDEIRSAGITERSSDGTRPLYDWWLVNPKGYEGAHYAVWTPEIATNLVLSMCPQHVCTSCGEPRRRILGPATYERTDSVRVPARLAQTNGHRLAEGVNQHHTEDGANTSVIARRETLGWSECECPGDDRWRRGVVLDPFGGSGTTGMVASGNGRDAILIDLDDRNAELARDRVGMFLEVVA